MGTVLEHKPYIFQNMHLICQSGLKINTCLFEPIPSPSLFLPYRYTHRPGSCRDRGNAMDSVVATQTEKGVSLR